MAIKRKQLGMKSGNKACLELRLYNKDGSRNMKGEEDHSKAVLRKFNKNGS